MRLYYFVHVSATDQGISGIPRVVKSLAGELVSMAGVELVPVSWSAKRETLVHTEQKLLDNLALYGGPVIKASGQALQPIETTPADWLLVPEAPHLGSHDRDYPSLLLDELVGFARNAGLPVAVLLHDIMPLTHRMSADRRSAFADMVSAADRGDDGERQRLRFAIYAHAVAMTDLVLPVSRTSADQLGDWLIRNGHRADQLPPIVPILLPEQALSSPRVVPHRLERHKTGPKEFLSVGTVGVHKNQLAAMAAFQRLIDHHPDLDVRFNVVGLVTSEVAVSASQLAKRSKGRIVLHGLLPDEEVEALRESSHASVFVSLAEGYGLPVAESLWRGKPCICSDDGSIAEVAAGGGCLLVNPKSLDEIERAFELMATDDALLEKLSQQIAARAMKSWRQYAVEVVDRIVGCSEGRLERLAWESRRTRGGSANERSATSAVLTLSASDLKVHDAYTRRERSMRKAGAIFFERDKDGEIREEVLFFGPYVWLPAGSYAFSLDGEISGELDLAMTAESGKKKLARVVVSSFNEPIVVDLPEAMNGFELVGHRKPSLERLLLRGAVVEYRTHSRDADPIAEPRTVNLPVAVATEAPGSSVGLAGAAMNYGCDDDGNPLSFPYAIPADGMRVHDAYNVGGRNILRSDSTIAFRFEDHGHVGENTLFFGPYLSLQPGNYTISMNGDIEGHVRLRLTQSFASECLLETVVESFEDPIRLKLTNPAEKFEIIGDRVDDTRLVTLRAIEIVREATDKESAVAAEVQPDSDTPVDWRFPTAAAEPVDKPSPGAVVRVDAAPDFSAPLILPASELRVRDAYGAGPSNTLRVGSMIEFDGDRHRDVLEPVLFSSAPVRLAPGVYDVRFHGALLGSLKLRFAKGSGGSLRVAVVKTFDIPTRVVVEQPLDALEIIGMRTKSTQTMTLASIEISGAPLSRADDRASRRRRVATARQSGFEGNV